MTVRVGVRFEVFKRDRFTCSYCGRTPPEILLEIDHIVPRAAGGTDDISNLTTACATCNRGKSARLLEEGTAPVVGKATVEELAERVEQAKAYMDLLGGLSTLIDRQIGMVIDEWAHAFGARLQERDTGAVWTFEYSSGEMWPNEASIRRFLGKLSLEDVIEAVRIAAAKFPRMPGTPPTRYFYGICYRAIRQGGSVSARPPEPPVDEFSAWQAGRNYENRRLREYFLSREEYGLETFADVVAALWPEED